MDVDSICGPWPIPGNPLVVYDRLGLSSAATQPLPEAAPPSKPAISTAPNAEKDGENLEHELISLSARLEALNIGALKGRFFGPTSAYSIANDALRDWRVPKDNDPRRLEARKSWHIQPVRTSA